MMMSNPAIVNLLDMAQFMLIGGKQPMSIRMKGKDTG
jgi:hypothetical protein